MAQHQSVHEGTAQELVPYLTRHPRQRFRLIELSTEDEDIPMMEDQPAEPQNLAAVFAELIEAAKQVEREPPISPTDPYDVAFRDSLQEKYRKMGLKR